MLVSSFPVSHIPRVYTLESVRKSNICSTKNLSCCISKNTWEHEQDMSEESLLHNLSGGQGCFNCLVAQRENYHNICTF